jgi:WD40 repeat protein
MMAAGLTIWFDFDDIPLGVDYQKQIDAGIQTADNFLFIISPHAVNSPYCSLEIELALKRGKRIIPLLHVEEISREIWQVRNSGGTDEQWAAYQAAGKHSCFPNMHPVISKINWVYFREGIDDFETSFQGLLAIFERQKDYVRQHTQLLAAALEWEAHQKRSQFLLTGQDRQQAEAWLQTRFGEAQPPCVPTDLHCEFITESIKNAHNLMTQVFLAHAEADAPVMVQIRRVLQREGITVWTSATDIRSGEDFRQAIERGIEQADNLVYPLSPASQASEFCQHELDYALSLNKRVIPILVQSIDEELMPEALRRLQYIEWRAALADDALTAIDAHPLLKALKDDAAYYNEHKVLLTQALKWERQQRNPSILLRGYNLRHAEAWWKVAQTRSHHLPTVLQSEFLRESVRQPPAQSLDVFISYSRVESDFARRLNEALQIQGKRTWFDQESIASGTDFQQEIYRGIETSDHFLFILSPEAVRSPYCADEVEYARKLNKRVVTVLHRAIDTSDLHPVLAAIQWIDFRQQDGDFNANFKELLRTLESDRAHIEAHTRLLLKALEWDKKEHRKELLLRGDEFVIAENWLMESFQQQKQPLPTPLQKDYIQAGREAQEREVKREKRRILVLRSLLAVMSLAFVAATGAGVYAYRLWNKSEIAQINNLSEKSNAQFLAGQNTDALITALEAGHQWEKHPRSDRQLVHQALQQAVAGVREFRTLEGHESVVQGIAFSPDGEVLASASNDGTIKLWSRNGELLQTLSGHEDGVLRVIFSPDGQTIASAGYDNTIRLWNLQGEPLKVLTNHESDVWDINFSPDGQTIASASGDHTAKLWNIDGEFIATLEGHENLVWDVAFSPDGKIVASLSDDRTIKLWTLEGKLLHTLVGHTDDLWDIEFSPDGQTIATTGVDRTIRLWSLQGDLLHTLIGHEDEIRKVAFSPDGRTLASASRDQTVKLWSIDGTLLHTLTGHEGDVVHFVTFNPDGKTLASSSSDGAIKIWNLNGKLLRTLTGHQGWVEELAYSPDGKILASASGDRTVKLWLIESEFPKILQDHDRLVTKTVFSPDGKTIATASGDYTIKLWKPNGELLRTLEGHQYLVYDIAFSPDSQLIASASEDLTVKLWNLEGQPLKTLEGHTGDVHTVKFSPDGTILASASFDNTAKLWDLNGNLLSTLVGHQDWVSSIAFSPDGKTLATTSEDGTVKFWSLKGNLIKTIGSGKSLYYKLAFSPDGKFIVAANSDHSIQLWSSTGELLHNLKGHKDQVRNVIFSPDGQTIASASSDRTVRLWSLDGKLLHTLVGHADRTLALAFSPDGRTLASASDDENMIKLWSVEGELLHTLVGHGNWVRHLAFSPDGQTLASSSWDGTAILWDLEALQFDALMQRGCKWWREYTAYQDTQSDEQRTICDSII